MKLTPQELKQIASLTLDHYNGDAEDFWEGTRGHDVSQNIAALLQYIEGAPPFTLLDLGCGPGRDLKALADRGHRAIGLDGAARFTAMARAYSGCEVWQQDFLKLDLPDGYFDGIFAMRATLKPRGVLFSSNPRGENEEGWSQGRYGTFHDWQAWQRYMSAAGLAELEHYYRPPGLPRNRQPWLASVWRKPS
ncbi:MAG: methyltransferase domain-containing protein [Candidatus Binataceae bacterium]